MLDLIKTRRSTRKFKEKPLDETLLDQVIEAGRYAPSGGNSQSCHFIVISNKNILDELSEVVKSEFSKMEETPGMYSSIVKSINASKSGNYVFHYNPPTLIVVANKKDYGNAMADSSCALQNMMLAANALDLGSCWINQLRWLRESPVIIDYLRKLGLKEDESIFGALSLGYPDTETGMPARNPLPRTGNEVTYVK